MIESSDLANGSTDELLAWARWYLQQADAMMAADRISSAIDALQQASRRLTRILERKKLTVFELKMVVR